MTGEEEGEEMGEKKRKKKTEKEIAETKNVDGLVISKAKTKKLKKASMPLTQQITPVQASLITPVQAPPSLKMTLSRENLNRKVELNVGDKPRKKLVRNFVINKSRANSGFKDEK